MPVLYPIGFLSFSILYWVYKVLLTKHYQKTSAFNQEIAFTTIYLFKTALFFHIAVTAFMYSN